MNAVQQANTSKGTFELNNIPYKDNGLQIKAQCPYANCWQDMVLTIDYETNSYSCEKCGRHGIATELLKEMFKDRPVVLIYPFDRSRYEYLK